MKTITILPENADKYRAVSNGKEFVGRTAGEALDAISSQIEDEVEHIIPLALEGETIEENLALSCRSCNIYKSDKTSFTNTKTSKEIRLFNPRIDTWEEHFTFQKESGEMSGITETGEATIIPIQIGNDVKQTVWSLIIKSNNKNRFSAGSRTARPPVC